MEPAKTRSLTQKVRNDLVYRALMDRKNMSVAEIQELLGVSAMTARRCLDDLHGEGLVKRVHGGATVVDLWSKDTLFQQRLLHRPEIKAKLAKRAFEFVPDNGSLFIDSGTSCFELARLLAKSPGDGVIITDGITAALELRTKKHYKTILVGGEIAEDGNTMDGSLAAEFVSNLSVDVMFFSASGFNDEYLENSLLAGCYAKKLLLKKARKSVCVIDSVKYCQQRCFRLFDWVDIDVLVTDSGLPKSALAAIRQQNVDVVLVEV